MQDTTPPAPLDAFFLFTDPEQYSSNDDPIKLRALLRAAKRPKDPPVVAVNSIKLRAAQLLKEEASRNHQQIVQQQTPKAGQLLISHQKTYEQFAKPGRQLHTFATHLQRSKTSMEEQQHQYGTYRDSNISPGVVPATTSTTNASNIVDLEIMKVYSQKQYTEAALGLLNQLRSPTSRKLKQSQTKTSASSYNNIQQSPSYLRERYEQLVAEFDGKRFAQRNMRQIHIKQHKNREREFKQGIEQKKVSLKQQTISQWQQQVSGQLLQNNYLRAQSQMATNKLLSNYQEKTKQHNDSNYKDARPQSQAGNYKPYFTRRAAPNSNDLLSLDIYESKLNKPPSSHGNSRNTINPYKINTASTYGLRSQNKGTAERISYFTTEDGNNCLSLQTKSNQKLATPDKFSKESSYRNTAQKQMKNSKSFGTSRNGNRVGVSHTLQQ